MNIKQFDNSELQKVLDHLVPLDSPYCIKIQSLITNTLYINPGFCLHISEHANIEMPVFISSECEAIAKTVVKEKKIEDWAVTYMLVLFYQRYGQAHIDNEAWQFMSAYLQIIIMIVLEII